MQTATYLGQLCLWECLITYNFRFQLKPCYRIDKYFSISTPALSFLTVGRRHKTYLSNKLVTAKQLTLCVCILTNLLMTCKLELINLLNSTHNGATKQTRIIRNRNKSFSFLRIRPSCFWRLHAYNYEYKTNLNHSKEHSISY